LTDSQYAALTPDQKKTCYKCKAAICQAITTTTAPASVASPRFSAIPDTATIASAVSTPSAPGTVLCHMMFSNSPHPSDASTDLRINGVSYRCANATHVYKVHDAQVSYTGALVDGGANGGLIRSDACILEVDLIATADAISVTDDVLSFLPIVQAAACIENCL
jgi:hypothetical protein